MNRFGWLEWIVKANRPLMFCENTFARRYSSLEPISVETLRALLEGITRSVEADVVAESPDALASCSMGGPTHPNISSQCLRIAKIMALLSRRS
ncbi:hypothetical protein PPTG_24279 [Phytophthora nicotianae INRA-310]|uniref:Uncharacterized protein n=3 Tax=Phytophthora nicotianae TaxID=4792 RepID=W2PJB2_PHYN3|nr:hypothetical protein PPTG_24279 [Phytophthora nicotianae INRA-310]ETI33061.1 hypothetical protein F443_20226 [Phytophthora nicotianae P1569]ETM33307.1 hypothetical protein L914_19443 [Phytophthora nicotianae]ETN00304.1 hypothetical protein PPTG_24279 [Phytophthora nicotianae INRA-310]